MNNCEFSGKQQPNQHNQSQNSVLSTPPSPYLKPQRSPAELIPELQLQPLCEGDQLELELSSFKLDNKIQENKNNQRFDGYSQNHTRILDINEPHNGQLKEAFKKTDKLLIINFLSSLIDQKTQ